MAPNGPSVSEEPTLPKLLGLLSCDQRRILVSTLIKGRHISILEKILAQENVEARNCYERLKKCAENKGGCSKTQNQATREDVTLSDSEEDDDSIDPTNWSPSIKEDFFKDFPETTNILILGETGVGKSTFINALANYLRFTNLHEAQRRIQSILILIKAHFTVSDRYYKRRRIVCEPTIPPEQHGYNENIKEGESSTKSPKSYLIPFGPPSHRRWIRIIDTPGIGDSRGIEQDKKNFAMILDFLAQFKEIHAICILMKPNETQLTLSYRFCINELLTRLHSSASKNILFCFTNVRQTLYKPGETLPTLKTYLTNLNNNEIQLDKSAVFCFDNESFRCLCALREGVTFTKNELDCFNKSWRVTLKEMFRLFKKISQLEVHAVEDTISINNVRSVILAMAKPLAEIAMHQVTNLQLIETKRKDIEKCMAEGIDLEGKLTLEQVESVVTNLDEPMTVCAAEKCITRIKMGNNAEAPEKIDYRTICHAICHVKGVQSESLRNENLKECHAFANPEYTCNKCQCSWEEHIHIQHRVDFVSKETVDPAVVERIILCGTNKEEAEMFLENLKSLKIKLEVEIAMVAHHQAEFAVFLKENSIMSVNGAYQEFAEEAIQKEKRAVAEGGSCDLLKVLEKNTEAYIAQAEVIENAHKGKYNVGKSVREINAMIEELKKLNCCGTVLDEIKKATLITPNNTTNRKKEVPVVVETKTGWVEKFHKFCGDFTSNAYNGKKALQDLLFGRYP